MAKQWTDERRAAKRDAMRQLWADPGRREAARARAAQQWTPEARQRARAAALARVTPEARAAAAERGRHQYDDRATKADAVYDGAAFGRLVVIKQRLARGPREPARALCYCDPERRGCGSFAIVRVDKLTANTRPTVSCGCKGVEAARRAVARAEGRLAYQLRQHRERTQHAEAVAAELGVR